MARGMNMYSVLCMDTEKKTHSCQQKWSTYKVTSFSLWVFLIMSGFHVILSFYIANKKKVVIGENNSHSRTNKHLNPEYQRNIKMNL